MEVDPEHARRLGGAEAGGVEHPERDRHLPENVAGEPLADDADDAVRDTEYLEASLEDAEERAIVSFVDCELAGRQRDVRDDFREPVEHVRLDVGEQFDAGDLLRITMSRDASPRRRKAFVQASM